MSDDINSTREELWESLKSRPYREAFVTSHLSTNIPAQIFTMREERGWTQQHLAEEAGMAQPRISVLEDGSYDKFNVKTLGRIASAFDVALVIKFVPFSELVDWVTRISSEKLAPPKFEDDRVSGGRSISQFSVIQGGRMPSGKPTIPIAGPLGETDRASEIWNTFSVTRGQGVKIITNPPSFGDAANAGDTYTVSGRI